MNISFFGKENGLHLFFLIIFNCENVKNYILTFSSILKDYFKKILFESMLSNFFFLFKR